MATVDRDLDTTCEHMKAENPMVGTESSPYMTNIFSESGKESPPGDPGDGSLSNRPPASSASHIEDDGEIENAGNRPPPGSAVEVTPPTTPTEASAGRRHRGHAVPKDTSRESRKKSSASHSMSKHGRATAKDHNEESASGSKKPMSRSGDHSSSTKHGSSSSSKKHSTHDKHSKRK